jgi:hypothetical protein
MNQQSLAYDIGKIAATVDASATSSISLGVSLSDSHYWGDYDTGARSSLMDGGRIIVPIRNGYVDSLRIEPLDQIDGYSYRARNGAWDYSASVIIYQGDTIFASSEYSVLAREGIIIFKSRQTESFTISIANPAEYKVGMRILAGDEFIYLYEMAATSS